MGMWTSEPGRCSGRPTWSRLTPRKSGWSTANGAPRRWQIAAPESHASGLKWSRSWSERGIDLFVRSGRRPEALTLRLAAVALERDVVLLLSKGGKNVANCLINSLG